MKKRFLLPLSLLFIFIYSFSALSFSGCGWGSPSKGSFLWKNANEESGKDYWRATYSYLKGWKSRGLTIAQDADGKCFLQVNVNTVAGEFDMTISDAKNNILYNYENLQTCQFDIELEDEGTYQVKIEGDEHEGGFSLKQKTND